MAAEFPLPSLSSSNPTPLYFEMLREEFVVGRTIYDDGGADYRLQNGGAGLKQWIIRYDGLDSTQAAILDAHLASTFYNENEGSAVGFNMRDPRTTILYGSVHYAPGGYESNHIKTWSQSRTIRLEKRP